MSAVGSIIDGIFGVGTAAVNNEYARAREAEARQQNYLYGEKAADAADARTRALYGDLYSPQAQLKQIKEAGLSPSIFYGDAGGISGQSGAQGPGASGISPSVFGVDPMTLANIRLANAQTEKTKEEAKNISSDTEIKDIQKELQEMTKTQFANEFKIINSVYYDASGNTSSAYEIAENSKDFNEFVKTIREMALYSGGSDLQAVTTTEQGMRALRTIYKTTKEYKTDIAILGKEELDANFQKEIIKELKDANYPNESAQELVQRLKTNKAINSLTEDQKSVWNRLLDRLGDKGTTKRDIAIVIAQIFMQHLAMKENMLEEYLGNRMK